MLQVLNSDYKNWAARYKIKIKTHECSNCNQEFLSTVPVADKGIRGLQIPDHGCPSEYNVAHFMIIDEKLESALLESITLF